MRLDAPRLYLRPLSEADVTPAYVAWLNDPEVNRYLETRHSPQTLQTVADFVAAVNARKGEHLFGIILRENDRHIGNIKLGPVHPVHRLGDVSLLIGERTVWSRGYAAEAIARLVRHAFDDLKLAKLSAGLYAANVGSERAFLKAGFVREGLRRAHYDLDGWRSDIVELGLVAPRADS
ncbi:MAG TPA: GNAT family N-acetyltransferase [Caulobacteraceae bacterium]|jgi:RimJ/RimL family protein N-acetyltransferase|nr:GNAT family N-acetyltransferase [Caulobacteraceae bacterium]